MSLLAATARWHSGFRNEVSEISPLKPNLYQMPRLINGAAIPALRRTFSFTEGKPDVADTRPILTDSSELPDQRNSKGKTRCVNSSDNTLVDGDTLLDNGKGRNLGADVPEPSWTAEMPERPKQPTPALHDDVMLPLLILHQDIDH